MNIGAIDASKALSNIGIKNTADLQKTITKVAEGISDVFSQSNESTTFKSIVDKYDITNISQKEANEMYKELYKNDLISLKDMLVTIDLSKTPNFQKGVTKISGTTIPSNENEKFNLLEQVTAQAEYNKTNGLSCHQKKYDERVSLAEKIHHFQK